MKTYRMPKTKRGARRQYNAIMAACRRDLAGGLSFGMDWPTLGANFPDRYNHLHVMNRAYKGLPA